MLCVLMGEFSLKSFMSNQRLRMQGFYDNVFIEVILKMCYAILPGASGLCQAATRTWS